MLYLSIRKRINASVDMGLYVKRAAFYCVYQTVIFRMESKAD